MPNPYADGQPAFLYYQTWLPVIVAVGALAVLVYIFTYPIEGIKGTIAKVVGALALLGTLPLSQERIGIGLNADERSMFILSILGLIVAAANGYYHYYNRKLVTEGAGPAVTEQADTPVEAAVPELDPEDDMGATMTQIADDSAVTPPGGIPVADPAATAMSGPDPVQPQAFLLVKSGPQAGSSIPITQAETAIGRSSDADIVLDDEQVSRVHANITYTDGQFTMVDTGSSGGTIVDGVAGETVVLQPGAEMKLGDTEIVFMQGQSTIVGSPPPAQSPTSAPPTAGADPGATIVAGPEPELVMKWLAITDGPGKGTTVQLKAGRTTIGREQANDVQIPDASVSREHAAILSS
ncbi:MAG: FHA domain-containing protein, partial [Dehalococcoidia bacterium]|nr:FHA domain-containing protein [Dehalococcoidia bacterium]